MANSFIADPVELERYRVGPFASHVDEIAGRLSEQGYARTTARVCLRIISDFSLWLEKRGLGVNAVDERRIVEFVRWRCRRGKSSRGGMVVAALMKWLLLLREWQVVATPVSPVDESALARVEQRFADYLVKERGLARSTVVNYLRGVRRFLLGRFGKADLHLSRLGPADINRFILRATRAVTPHEAVHVTGALRAFFRFLQLRGEIGIDLAAAVPTVACWRHSTLPKFLRPEEVKRLLDRCDWRTRTGKRDYAILLLLARLGLRAGEVVSMTLDDIDWEAGELVVRGKGLRRDRSPIPKDVGKALATYLKEARPPCSTRRIFVRAKAPCQGFSTSAAICDIVRTALARAGLDPPFKGSHLLRHSLATGMLGRGATLSEIGQILRHRLPQTTEIYAKVDVSALRALAQPWPETWA